MTEAGPSARPHPKKSKQKQPKKHGTHTKKLKRISEKERIETLEKAATDYTAPDGLSLFTDLPISDYTKRGLKKAFFVNMTDIQSKSIPISLKGKDVLGAARTGSGKTLAFLIPVLEILYRRKWGPQDGLGALIISPTRELAAQIFEVLRSIGQYHSFSAGLVIGGPNNVDGEKERLSRMNILVATPGRLLQHMDQTVGFEPGNVQILVLDEADRLLDMGFARNLNALVAHLPKSRQTLLFSATQTDSVSDLARLSLHNPVFVGTQDAKENAMPKSLEQHYVLCTLDKKLDILWSFIKSHLQSKILVFLSSGKQVRFVFETFRKMHPGVPLLHLHGKQKQTARLAMYTRFTSSSHAVLFATDIAARGLDFPAVDWVLQVDAPEDAETYIHRVGRTARYESAGKALLFLMPSEEEGMKAALSKKNIEVAKIKIKASKTQSIENQLQKLAFQEPEIKYLGQRAFVSYLRSVHLHKDKSIFKVGELPVERFAESLGLLGAPKIKFLNAKNKKNASRDAIAAQAEAAKEQYAAKEDEADDDDDDSNAQSSDEEDMPTLKDDVPQKSKPAVRTKYDRMFERKNQGILSEHYSKLIDHSGEGDDNDDEFITLKRADHDLPDAGVPEEENLSRRKMKLGKAKRTILKNSHLAKKIVFDDEGRPHELYEVADAEEFFKDGLEGAREAGKKFAEGERGKLKEADVLDKEEAKEKKKEKKRKRKEREHGEDFNNAEPELAPLSEDDGYVSPEFDLPSGGSDDDEPPPTKRSKKSVQPTIEDEEELALKLLQRRR